MTGIRALLRPSVARATTAAASAACLAVLCVAPAAAAPGVDRIATVRVDGDAAEFFQVRLSAAEDIAAAEANLAGAGTHLNGRVVRTGPDVNAGYPWHLDPADVQFVERSMDMCDGLPSRVTAEPGYSRYCPWRASVVGLRPAAEPYRPGG